MYVVLVYDISGEDNGQKILTKTFKICKKYLSHIQNSVFEGNLTEAQILQLKYDLQKIIRKDLDSVILFKSREERWLEKQIWAKDDMATSNFL